MWQMALMDMFKQNQQAKGGGANQGAPMPDLMQQLNGIMGLGQKQRPNPQSVWQQMGYSHPYDFGLAYDSNSGGGMGFAPSTGNENPWVSFNQKYMPSGSMVGRPALSQKQFNSGGGTGDPYGGGGIY